MIFSLFGLLSKIFLFTGKISGNSAYLAPLDATREKELFDTILHGDAAQKRAAEEELCAHNLRLVAHISKKFRDSKLSQDDLMSLGSIGLLKAVRTYSAEKSNFSTYASRCIQNEILMFLRYDKKNRNEMSFEECVGTDKDGNEICLLEILSSGSDLVERQSFARLECEQLLHKIETKLDAREREILALRFGLFGNVPHTQKEVAKILNISRSYVSRIETAGIHKLKN